MRLKPASFLWGSDSVRGLEFRKNNSRLLRRFLKDAEYFLKEENERKQNAPKKDRGYEPER
ncbi:hypothetical protein C6W20_14710 [Bacillus sp. NMCN6]|nr:hypothetical protein C6W20_14710 [Bacillus sp. NMCN6]